MSGVHSRHDLLFLIYQSARKGVNGNKQLITRFQQSIMAANYHILLIKIPPH
jgi:hypothetical protein